MGYLTGGPQRYTGRPIDEAHMHLGISPQEWRRFMQVADDVFEKIALPTAARREVREILMGFEQQCVLPRGAVAPPDPGAHAAYTRTTSSGADAFRRWTAGARPARPPPTTATRDGGVTLAPTRAD